MSKKIKGAFAPETKQKKDTLIEFIFSCISCWLLSVGACLLFDAQFSFQAGLSTVILQTLATIIVVAAITRKWWIPLVCLGIGGLTIGIAFLKGADFGAFFNDVKSFVQWFIDFQPDDSDWYTEKSFNIIHTVINIFVTTAFFAITRITRRGWINAIITLIIIICIYAFGSIEYDIMSIVFIFVGLFTMVGDEKFRGHKLFKKSNSFSVIGNNWLVTVICAVICVAISMGAVLTLDNDKPLDIRNRFSSNIAADAQTAADFYTYDQQAQQLTTFKIGLQQKSKYIGGSLYKDRKAVIAKTDSKEPLLMRMTTYKDYNGKKWTDSFKKTYRINGPWKKMQTSYLAGNIINNNNIFTQIRSLGNNQKVKITLLEKSNFLPVCGQVLSFTENTKQKNPILFDERGQVISYFGVEKGFTYTIDTLTYLTDESFNLLERQMIAETIASSEDPIYTEEFVESYTKIPKQLPDEAEVVLDQMDIDKNNPFDTAFKISDYFSVKNGFTYNEKTPYFKESDDVVDMLFKTKTGHCMYYSTAMIMMTRKLGIPSRLAAGYQTVKGDDGYHYLSLSEPFCWVECYFKGIGWVAFNPSPGKKVNVTITNKPDKPTDSDVTSDLERPEVVKPEKDQQPEEKPKVETKKFPWVSVIIPSSVLLLIILYLVIRGLWAPTLYNPEKIKQRYRSNAVRAEFYWRNILRLYRQIGFKWKEADTMRELTTLVSNDFVYRNEEVVMAATYVYEALKYGNKIPSDDDINKMIKALECLEMEAKWKMTPLTYFLKRRVFLPLPIINKKKYDPEYLKIKL